MYALSLRPLDGIGASPIIPILQMGQESLRWLGNWPKATRLLTGIARIQTLAHLAEVLVFLTTVPCCSGTFREG